MVVVLFFPDIHIYILKYILKYSFLQNWFRQIITADLANICDTLYVTPINLYVRSVMLVTLVSGQ